jgi:pSer/pThr/pTyr-binding forkhead associated (FHA) protein
MMTNYGRLILISAGSPEQVFPLSASQIRLGRDETNDIVLSDRQVSRLHARLECNEQGCILVDAGSANGTLVDGQLIKRVKLQSGSLIELGQSTLRFEQEALPSARSRPKPVKSGRRGQASADQALLSQFLDKLEQGTLESASPAEAASLRDQLLRIPRLIIHTPEKTWEIQLKNQESWTIGRTPENDIIIDHQKVSRQHARIERQADKFVIRDLDSTNGTYLGQQPLQAHTLRHADTLFIGNVRLIFKDVRQADQSLELFSEQEARKPVIVVPGQFGSALWRGEEKIWPNVRTIVTQPEKFEVAPDNPIKARGIVDEVVVVPGIVEIESYSRIHNYLDDTLGYTLGKDLLEFSYDWRDDVRLAAQKLAQMVDHWDRTEPVTIIAHSLGCLVSRYYVDCLGGNQKVRRLILMGGPNYGSPNALLTIFSGNIGELESFLNAISGSLLQNIRQTFITFLAEYQMLPTHPCIFDPNGQPVDIYKERGWLPPEQQRLLQASYEFQQALSRQATVPTLCIVGYGIKTLTRLNVSPDLQGRWQNVEMINTMAGDGQIPTQSAILQGAEIHPVRRSHNQLYIDDDVLWRLNYELTGHVTG